MTFADEPDAAAMPAIVAAAAVAVAPDSTANDPAAVPPTANVPAEFQDAPAPARMTLAGWVADPDTVSVVVWLTMFAPAGTASA